MEAYPFVLARRTRGDARAQLNLTLVRTRTIRGEVSLPPAAAPYVAGERLGVPARDNFFMYQVRAAAILGGGWGWAGGDAGAAR